MIFHNAEKCAIGMMNVVFVSISGISTFETKRYS
jgi:hypothetical protein